MKEITKVVVDNIKVVKAVMTKVVTVKTTVQALQIEIMVDHETTHNMTTKEVTLPHKRMEIAVEINDKKSIGEMIYKLFFVDLISREK
jgi:hypothetical protein